MATCFSEDFLIKQICNTNGRILRKRMGNVTELVNIFSSWKMDGPVSFKRRLVMHSGHPSSFSSLSSVTSRARGLRRSFDLRVADINCQCHHISIKASEEEDVPGKFSSSSSASTSRVATKESSVFLRLLLLLLRCPEQICSLLRSLPPSLAHHPLLLASWVHSHARSRGEPSSSSRSYTWLHFLYSASICFKVSIKSQITVF